ncbi:MAG TPA: hypothetical protein PKE57_07865 [Cellvibrionaceae bacterium]|nr:hypothetical protein [Cellvibrionaceae bacterium]HMW71537.1 hypothetical protein [Cellvibrionaceae bacterium]HMY40687.1 hypothetical protein [Marinagarivorans sp.]HNG58690.1 hypothetical protein [Cellvibrionaceae bacterium]
MMPRAAHTNGSAAIAAMSLFHGGMGYEFGMSFGLIHCLVLFVGAANSGWLAILSKKFPASIFFVD